MTEPQHETPHPDQIDEYTEALILQLQDVRSQIDLLTTTARDLTMAIEARVRRTAVFRGVDGQPWRATVVRPDPKVKVDLYALGRVMPAEYFEQATKRVLDTEGFKRLAKAGVITPEVVEAACTFTESTPSVRLMPVTNEETPADE